MTQVVHQEALVDQTRSVHVCSQQFQPGSKVDVIVLVERADRPESGATNTSFFDGIQKIRIDAPVDYSVNFEQGLYDHDV